MKHYPIIVLATFAFTAIFFAQFEGCVTAPVAPTVKVSNLPGWNDNWTPAIMAGFKGNSLQDQCPKWSTVDKQSVWLKFWENIIQHESGMNPKSTYTETGLGIDPITHKQVVSAGLLQLSFQDVPNYRGDCMAMSYSDNPNAIFDPLINIKCGMYIANRLMQQSRSIGAYWSTARAGTKSMNDWKTYGKECF